MLRCYPKYVITTDGYIGTFQTLYREEYPVYRFPGGDRIADDYEILTGSDDREELLKRCTKEQNQTAL